MTCSRKECCSIKVWFLGIPAVLLCFCIFRNEFPIFDLLTPRSVILLFIVVFPKRCQGSVTALQNIEHLKSAFSNTLPWLDDPSIGIEVMHQTAEHTSFQHLLIQVMVRPACLRLHQIDHYSLFKVANYVGLLSFLQTVIWLTYLQEQPTKKKLCTQLWCLK